MAETETAPNSTDTRESGKSGGAAGGKVARKSLEDRLAEIQAEEKKLREQIRERNRLARAQFEKDLWALLKAEKFDEAPIEAWRKAVPSIGAALKAAAK